MRPKILFATRTSPFAGESGSGAYVFDLLSHLHREGFDLQVIWTKPPDLLPTRGWYTPPLDARKKFRLEIRHMLRVADRFWCPAVVWTPFKTGLRHRAKTVLRTLRLLRDPSRPAANGTSSPHGVNGSSTVNGANGNHAGAATPPVDSWDSVASSSEVAFIRDAIARHRPAAVIANYSWLAQAVRAPNSAAPAFAVLTHDVRHRQLHLREGRIEEVHNGKPTPADEAAQLAGADALIAIQPAEAAVFSRLLPGKRVVTASMAVAVRPLPRPGVPTALFVGSGHHANLAGLRWFLAEVWPRLHRELPGARLLIAGSICSALTEDLPSGVEKLGRLPDLASAYLQASVVVAPILQGSGIKIKLIEALGFCRPCVTTSVGVEGLENFLPALRVADTPEAFARETLALLRDPALATATATRLEALARQHLSTDACYGPVVALLRELSAASAPPALSSRS